MRIKYKYKGNYHSPKKQTVGSAGIDLFNNTDKDITIEPGEYAIISTGFMQKFLKDMQDYCLLVVRQAISTVALWLTLLV